MTITLKEMEEISKQRIARTIAVRESRKRTTITRRVTIKLITGSKEISKIGNPYYVVRVVYDQNGEEKVKKVALFTDEAKFIINKMEENTGYEVTVKKIDGYWRWVNCLKVVSYKKKTQ